MKKIVTSIAFLFLTAFTLSAQFSIAYNRNTGAIKGIQHPTDPYKMNWIFSSSDTIPTWQKAGHDWGMGKYSIQSKTEAWQTPSSKTFQGNNTNLLYKTPYLDISVDRKVQGSYFVETYRFRNNTSSSLKVDSLRIYTPFNDHYPDARTCATNRCNAHIWPGLHSSYVNAIRMGGRAPHLGLVFTEGAMESYSVENRGLDGGGGYRISNTRGTLVLNMPVVTLAPDETYTVQWKIFWHKGWDEFFAVAKKLGFVRLEADKYAVKQNEASSISVDAASSAGVKDKTIQLNTDQLGEQKLSITYGENKSTVLNYLVVSSPENLIDQRVRYIVAHQQMNNPADPRYGAYMVYDLEGDSILTNPRVSVAPSDKDEGRERLGMGVFIAKWLQTHKDTAVYASLLRYVSFVRNKLQTPDYKVFSDVAHRNKHRGYNYPWVADLYLQMYFLTGEVAYLKDYYYTINKFYKEFGYDFYAIGIPVQMGIETLQKAGLRRESDSLLNAFKAMGAYFIKNGIYYPKHEVNYEQSIVAPAVLFLLELYAVSKDQQFLREAKRQMPSLEAFSGKQPDVHLNEIALRHWDGYWFGKKEMWGDVMPHYWSVLTANAFQKYFECTGEKSYQKRARRIAENNLLNFKEDGKASCAYIYPLTVNGAPGKFYDPYANDQDWALYYYLQIQDAGKKNDLTAANNVQ